MSRPPFGGHPVNARKTSISRRSKNAARTTTRYLQVLTFSSTVPIDTTGHNRSKLVAGDQSSCAFLCTDNQRRPGQICCDASLAGWIRAMSGCFPVLVGQYQGERVFGPGSIAASGTAERSPRTASIATARVPRPLQPAPNKLSTARLRAGSDGRDRIRQYPRATLKLARRNHSVPLPSSQGSVCTLISASIRL